MRNGRIEVHLYPPGALKPTVQTIDLDPREFDMSPLPRAREIFWDEAMRARQQAADRRDMSRLIGATIGARIADAIVEALASHDTINGYQPEAYHKMMAPATDKESF